MPSQDCLLRAAEACPTGHQSRPSERDRRLLPGALRPPSACRSYCRQDDKPSPHCFWDCPSGKLPVKLTGNRETPVAGPRGRQAQDQVAFGYSHRVHMPVFNVSHEGFGGAERKGSCQCVKT